MIITIIVFLLTLLILVVSHEFGHLLAAKKFGVKVLEFAFGFPPKLWSKRIGETKYILNSLPIGGYVKLLGEDEVDPKIRDDKRSFANQRVEKRIGIVAGGVIVNLLLSWVLFYIVLIAQDFRIVYPTIDPVVTIADLEEGKPAKASGIQIGERLISVDGVEVKNIDEAVRLIKSKPNQELILELSDIEGKQKRLVNLTPMEIAPGEGRIGVVFSPVPFKIYSTPLEKVFSAPLYSLDLTKITFKGLGKLISDVASQNYKQASEAVSGPIGLVGVTNQIVSGGWSSTLPYLWFMGVISLTLAVFNSLPFPALDGGRILFMVIELVTRKKVNPEVEKMIHTVGMVILLALMVLITVSDIRKLLI